MLMIWTVRYPALGTSATDSLVLILASVGTLRASQPPIRPDNEKMTVLALPKLLKAYHHVLVVSTDRPQSWRGISTVPFMQGITPTDLDEMCQDPQVKHMLEFESFESSKLKRISVRIYRSFINDE